MASNESFQLESIKRFARRASSIVQHVELDTQESTAPIVVSMTPTSSPTISSRSSKKKHSTESGFEHPNIPIRKRRVYSQISLNNFKSRLRMRELFHCRLAIVSNMMCFIAILGIILMIIANELTFVRVNNQDTKASWFIKLIITFSTVILLCLLFYYHYLNIKLYSFRNSIEAWYVELTIKNIILIIIEILICIIHPVPRFYPRTDPEILHADSTNFDDWNYISYDVALGLPMFLRLYLVARVILFQSALVRNISLRSLGYFNKVPIDFFFLMKTYFERWSTRCLIIIAVLIFLIGSWALRACDYADGKEHMSMTNAMWLFIITFTTVGYGDISPSTYCGRFIAAMTGLVGLFLSALLIAILSVKLSLTREEKYINTYVSDIQLATKAQNEAANIIKYGITVWYLKLHNKTGTIRLFHAQRNLFRSIHHFQAIRRVQRNFVDRCVGFRELIAVERNIQEETEEIVDKSAETKSEIKEIKEKLNSMDNRIEALQNTLNILLDRVT